MNKERILIFALLLIPAIAAFIGTRPMPAQYILQGEMHPVKDLGVQGSVFFRLFKRVLLTISWSVGMYIPVKMYPGCD